MRYKIAVALFNSAFSGCAQKCTALHFECVPFINDPKRSEPLNSGSLPFLDGRDLLGERPLFADCGEVEFDRKYKPDDGEMLVINEFADLDNPAML